MANQPETRLGAGGYAQTQVAFDAGLRAHMLSVYNYMTSGVLLTGLVALGMYMSGAVSALIGETGPSALGWVVMFAPLGLVLWMGFGIHRMAESTAKMIFWVYAVLMGASLSTIFLAYTGASIATTFFAAAAAFGALSLYGYTTQKDLSGMGTFLIMGLVGLIIASLINIFLKSSTMDFVISAVGVLLFAGLTAYDTQKIKNMYFEVAGSDFHGRAVVMGALTLYLDFINMFLFLLRFMGQNRE